MYSLGNSWAGRKCPISGGAKRCQTARESIPPQNPGSGGQGFGVGIDSCPASGVTVTDDLRFEPLRQKGPKKANLTFCMGKRMYVDFTSVFLCGENATHHILPLWLRAQKSELRMLYGESHVFVFLLGCK